MAKQTVALEVLSYHATAQKEETDKLMVRSSHWLDGSITYNMHSFKCMASVAKALKKIVSSHEYIMPYFDWLLHTFVKEI